ncbi:LamG-like jellyroll fold domain-containing protein [Parasediminibacterium paludis]|uniref:LamG-like jellyroll fold domain-containing protein n=1 Tax=Parasediminibacterium paludis TaxID=908966 RepID=A0ABV8PTF8_9BACT
MKNLALLVLLLVSFKAISQVTISVQPSTAPQTVCVGTAATSLSITASGTGLTYQWYSNTVNNNTGGTIINGATSNAYTPSTATAGTLYYYAIVVSTDLSTATSQVSGAVTVNALPTATFTTSPSVACSGFPVQFNGASACASNGALNFSGSASSALRSTITTQIDNITMEVWAKWSGGVNSNRDNQMIFYNGHTGNGGYGILMDANGNLQILIGGLSYLGSSQNLTPGVWSHIAIVRNSGTWSLYVNGVQYSVSNNTTTPRSPTVAGGNQTMVGVDQSGTGHLFYGAIDEVTFWTVARSSANIQADMTASSVSPQSGLLAYWNFNEGTGTTANDGSGNAYGLTLTGTNWLTAGAPTGATYAWDFGGGASANLGSTAYTYSTSGTKNISLAVTDLTTGCVSSTTNAIIVNLSPTANISGTATACNTVSLTASGGATYAWSGGNSTNTATNTFSTSNTYTVTVTDAIGCTATASQAVTVNPLPTAPINGPVASTAAFVTSGLSLPYSVAKDASGNLYVANYGTNSISKVNTSGSVTSFVSSGLNRPSALAFDVSGNLFVANYFGNSISKVSKSGVVTSFASSGMSSPSSLAFDGSGNLYVANFNGNSIIKVSTNGTVTSFVSSGLNRPSALAFDSSGNLYVANYNGNSISQVSANGTVTSFVSAGLSSPAGLAFDSFGNLYVSNYGNSTISKVSKEGTVTNFAITGLNRPRGILYDNTANLFYVANYSGSSVSKITPPANYVPSVCNTGTVTLIATPNTNETIDWYSAASGGSVLLSGSNSFTTPTLSTTTTYYAEARNTITGCVSATRTALTATVNNCPITWMGGTSSDFNDPSNWSSGTVPNVVNDFIVASSANNPIITGTYAVNNFTINSGASLTVTGTIKIAGSVTNNGTLTATSGTVEFNGSTAQTIPANTFSSNTVQNLTINNTAGVTLGGTLNLTGVLTPTAGTLTTGGFLTLTSTTISGGGAIGQGNSSGGYISGTVNVQRFTQAQRGYRTIANPFTTAQSLNQLTNIIRVTGLTTATGTGTYAVSSGNPSAFYYDPTKPAGTSSVLQPIRDANSTAYWPVGSALYVFVRGNGMEGAGGPGVGNYSSGTISPVTLGMAGGSINQGPVTVNLTYGDGTTDNFNLIGNPYPCPINLKNVTGISSFGTVYVYDPVANTGLTDSYTMRGGFHSYSNDGSTDIIIPSLGGFYIKATGTGQSITFNESDKATATTPTYTIFGNNQPTPRIRLAIGTVNGNVDDLKFGFNANSTALAHDFFDAPKLSNSLFDFYSLSADKQRLSIDYRNSAQLDSIIPLGIATSVTGTYALRLAELSGLPNTQVVLIDKYLKTKTVLSQVGDSYSFIITADTATKSENRFEISLLSTTVLPVTITDITAQLQNNKTVAVRWTSATEVNLASYNLQRSLDGSNFNTVNKLTATGSGNYIYNDDLSFLHPLPSTVYYRLQSVDNNANSTYSKVVSCSLFNSDKQALTIYPNPVQATLLAQVTVAKAGAVQLRVLDAQGKVVTTQKTQLPTGTTSISIPITQLTVGNYVLEIQTAEGKQIQRFVKE